MATNTNTAAFANARFVIRYRACAIFGNLAGFARFAGISRQALDNRIRSAERWPLSHHWFGFVLVLPEPLWCYDAAAIAALPLPHYSEIEDRRQIQTEVWQTAYFKRYAWSSFAAVASLAAGGQSAVDSSAVESPDNDESSAK